MNITFVVITVVLILVLVLFFIAQSYIENFSLPQEEEEYIPQVKKTTPQVKKTRYKMNYKESDNITRSIQEKHKPYLIQSENNLNIHKCPDDYTYPNIFNQRIVGQDYDDMKLNMSVLYKNDEIFNPNPSNVYFF